MDAPPIQYCRTDDDVNIAYWTLGAGPTLLLTHNAAFSHLDLEWDVPDMRRWYEWVVQRFRLVRYDHRRCGLSDRDAEDLSLEAHTRDIAAVADALQLQHFAILGINAQGPTDHG